MNKHVLAVDRDAVDREIERLKPIVELGGYLPCPDHRLPPNVVWENVQYYCDKFRRTFKYEKESVLQPISETTVPSQPNLAVSIIKADFSPLKSIGKASEVL
ncbi:MAG: hypothetical protein LBQ14_05425 [Treponema sp.]|jgi:hypothetical protein|nr:hypothetical protein [Treponema sp.]